MSYKLTAYEKSVVKAADVVRVARRNFSRADVLNLRQQEKVYQYIKKGVTVPPAEEKKRLQLMRERDLAWAYMRKMERTVGGLKTK